MIEHGADVAGSSGLSSDVVSYRMTFGGRDITRFVTDVSSRPVRYGGPSDVHTGLWHPRDRPLFKVAIKVVRLNTPSHAVLRRLRREIVIWSGLYHPHIQPLTGLYWDMGEIPAMVSRWYDFGDINSYISRRPWEATARDASEFKLTLIMQAMQGLEYLHTRSPVIVHGDIKGANVLVADDGSALLCDFGIASIVAEHTVSSYNSAMKGTCRWMAPELFDHDDAKHSVFSDIWSAGCLTLEVLSEAVPYFTKKSDQAVILALARHELPARPPGLADLLWDCVLVFCAVAPELRPSVGDVCKVMQGLCSAARSSAPDSPSPPFSPWPTPQSLPLRYTSSALPSPTERSATPYFPRPLADQQAIESFRRFSPPGPVDPDALQEGTGALPAYSSAST